MSKASMNSFELGRARSPAPKIDKCVIIPILASAYSAIIGPLIYFSSERANTLQGIMESQWENRIFWPAMAGISVVLAVQNRSRLARLTLPPHIICLLAYLAFAGASVLWAFKPELSIVRYVQQVMVIASIVLPALVADRTTDLLRGLFLCFALAAVLNIYFVSDNPPSLVKFLNGYPGYFTGKNLLGEFSAITLLLALHESLYSGFRRVLGIIILVIAISLLLLSASKTAFGLAIGVPILAGLTLIAGRKMRISPAILLLSIPAGYLVLSSVSNFNMSRISFMLYGDSTFTGRTLIWDFAHYEIARRPLLGWGYQSFWLVGPDAPSVVDATGWIKGMPNAHSGYLDTMLEMGYVGFALLVTFLLTTIHATARVADRSPKRAWILLSLVLFITIYDFLETLWMRGFDILWVVFVIVAAEIGRHWQPFPAGRVASPSRTPTSRTPGGGIPVSSRGARRPGLRMPIQPRRVSRGSTQPPISI